MDCPRCRHWVPDRANFCNTCGHQFALKVVKARGSRLSVVVFLLGVLALIVAYAFIRLNSGSTGGRTESIAVSTLPLTRGTPDVTSTPIQVSGTPAQEFTATRPEPEPSALPDTVDSRPVALNRPKPNYTEDARRNRVEGTIKASALVDPGGFVNEVRLLSHLPDGLDQEAKRAIQEMRFRPGKRNGLPVAAWVTLEVEFNLK